MFEEINKKLDEIMKLTDPEDFLTRKERMHNAGKVWELARSIKSLMIHQTTCKSLDINPDDIEPSGISIVTAKEISPYKTTIKLLKEEKITVPVCNSCEKPLTGREKSEDRCWCDTIGNWTIKEIDKEQIEMKKEIRS